MPKTYNVRELVLEMIEEEDLSLEVISNRVRKKLYEKILDKTINETLMSLLKERKIEIVDYDFEVYERRRMQSIKTQGIIFSSMKRGTFEIEVLIRELESKDLKKAMKSYKILKKKFRNKMRNIEMEDEMNWENLKKTLISKSFDTEEKQQTNPLKREFEDDQNFENPDPKKESILNENIKLKTPPHNINTTKERSIKFFGSIPPKKMNTTEIDNLFDKIIDYINSQELIPKKILLHNLKISLSETKKSNQSLKKIISCIELSLY